MFINKFDFFFTSNSNLNIYICWSTTLSLPLRLSLCAHLVIGALSSLSFSVARGNFTGLALDTVKVYQKLLPGLLWHVNEGRGVEDLSLDAKMELEQVLEKETKRLNYFCVSSLAEHWPTLKQFNDFWNFFLSFQFFLKTSFKGGLFESLSSQIGCLCLYGRWGCEWHGIERNHPRSIILPLLFSSGSTADSHSFPEIPKVA